MGIFTTPLVEEVFFATSLFSSMKYILTLTYAIASSDEVNLTIKKVKKYIFIQKYYYIFVYILILGISNVGDDLDLGKE